MDSWFDKDVKNIQWGNDLGWPLLAAAWDGASVPWPEIKVRTRQSGYQILATRLVVSDKALIFWLCRKEFPQRWKVVKQEFIRTKKSIAHVGRPTGGLRESRTLIVAWITFLGHFFQVFFGQSLCWACFWARIWYISGFSYVRMRIS